MPPDAPPFAAAREAGIDIVSEVEIGLRFLPRLSYIAVTGSKLDTKIYYRHSGYPGGIRQRLKFVEGFIHLRRFAVVRREPAIGVE